MQQLSRRDFLKYTSAGIGVMAAGMPARLGAKEKAEKDRNRPNVLWIMMDDCRADALGCYGRSWPNTPNFDSIANRGVLFKTAIVQNAVCTPSRMSMLSGHYPHQLGVMAMGRPPAVKPMRVNYEPNLLNAWRRVGIQPVNVGKSNGSVAGRNVYEYVYGYDSDWDQKGDFMPYFDAFGKPNNDTTKAILEKRGMAGQYPIVRTGTYKWMIGGTVPLKPEETSVWKLGSLAVENIKGLAAKEEPFFLRVSFNAPHVPFVVPKSLMIDPDKIYLPLPTQEELKNKPRFERENLHIYSGAPDLTKKQIQIARATYYSMISLVDLQVGRILEVLRKNNLMENTIIAVNADQGVMLGEHGIWKKRCFYDENVCVPLIISYPKTLPKGKIIDEPVEMVDFLPTLMDMSGFKVPDYIGGRSMTPLIKGDVKQFRPACFSEHDHSKDMYEELRQGTGRRVMARTREWKMVWFMDDCVADKDGALYNLKKDPGEKNNLYNKPEYKDIIAHLENLAKKWDQQE